LNKKFILIIAAFTITVPGFFIFSYIYLGVFSGATRSEGQTFAATVYAGEHRGDYNKTGEQIVQTRRLLQSYALPCEPVLVYFENAITVGKPNLKSAGGCITEKNLPAHVVKDLAAQGKKPYEIKITPAYKFTIYAQTAIALRKIWTELARLTDAGRELQFPLVQIVRPNGDNDFFIAPAQTVKKP
jgi:hypothetical protein